LIGWLFLATTELRKKLRESYDVVKSASKIRIQHFYDNFTRS